MKFIGITGGVGAGKTEILNYLSAQDGIKVMLADEIAHDLMEKGTKCNLKLQELFKEDAVFLCGKNYCKYLITKFKKGSAPMAHMRIGQQQKFLKERIL